MYLPRRKSLCLDLLLNFHLFYSTSTSEEKFKSMQNSAQNIETLSALQKPWCVQSGNFFFTNVFETQGVFMITMGC